MGWAHLKASVYTGQYSAEKHGFSSMLHVSFEHTIPEFERTETASTLDRTAAGIGIGRTPCFSVVSLGLNISLHLP